MKEKKQQLIDIFAEGMINKSGFCKVAGISQQHLNKVLLGSHKLTPQLYSRIEKGLEKHKELINNF